ncbi:polyprenyl synthetase family protein [Nonomuraea phyllanthi]|uniref:Polyprenyl synthetase family protein n=1 Tax=Nonomuraea phyllanthi TaxID=2219224 RepID=A0A5C4WDW0_9ACTN|nr:polyprenyl synthetase family protein [Nonomuraea phyllanthi]KAB8193066.1 polyprenyl synthetase family protein [Nonomuraea phyllanthi]QFY11072.1 polyprenyl synthetase family protein [Nonomuraea phyllanthi]
MTLTLPPAEAARELVEPVLREAVDRLDARAARVARYHFGWVDEAGRPAAAGGKALRPTLAVLSGRAAGAGLDGCLPAAAAVELVHAFSLLHDDVMDDDPVRRHRPAAWTVFGRSAAILCGNALLTVAGDLLLEQGTQGHVEAARALNRATLSLVAGQALDLEFQDRGDVTLDECLLMSRHKTASLLACACSIGVTAAGGPAALTEALTGFGTEAGLAFQLADDLLGIWGRAEQTGKPVLSDLRTRKKSLPVVAALTGGTPAGHRLAGLLARPEPLAEADLHDAARLIEEAGGRAWAEREAARRLDAATRHLANADLPPDVRDEFLHIARFLASRDH